MNRGSVDKSLQILNSEEPILDAELAEGLIDNQQPHGAWVFESFGVLMHPLIHIPTDPCNSTRIGIEVFRFWWVIEPSTI